MPGTCHGQSSTFSQESLEPTGRLLLGGQQSRILDLSHHDCNMKNDLARPDSRPEEGRAIWADIFLRMSAGKRKT